MRPPADRLSPIKPLALDGRVWQQIVERLRHVLGMHACALYGLERATGNLVLRAVAAERECLFHDPQAARVCSAIMASAVGSRRPVFVPDLASYAGLPLLPEAQASLRRTPFRAMIGAPLILKERVLGAVGGVLRAGTPNSEQHLEVARHHLDHAAIMLERARLLEEVTSRHLQSNLLLKHNTQLLRRIERKFALLSRAELSQRRVIRAERDAAKSHAARLKALNELAAVVNSTLNPERVFELVAEAASRVLDGAAAFVWAWDEKTERLRLQARHRVGHSNLQSDSSVPEDGLTGWVFRRRKAVQVSDALADRRTVDRDWVEAGGLRAFVGAPLVLRGRCLGVLSAWRESYRPFQAADLEVLRALAAHAAAAIENANLYGRVVTGWDRLRVLVETMPAGVVVEEEDRDGGGFRVLMANPAFHRLLRAERRVLAAHTSDFDLLRPDGTPYQEDDLPQCGAILRGEVLQDVELTVRFPDGTVRYLLANAQPLSQAAEGPRQGIAVFQDITDSKRAVDELRAHSRQQEAVAGLGQDALAGAEPAALMQKTVGVVAEVLGVEYSDVLELVPEGDALVMRAGRGWQEGTARAARVSAGTDSQSGYTLMTNDPVVVEDTRAETRFAAAGLHEHGVVSSMTVIIPGHRRPYGVLGAYTARQRRLTDHDIHFLQAVANVLATAIERKLAEDELSKAAAENEALYEQAETERRWLRTILDAIPEAVVVGEEGPGGEFRLVMANRARAQILGTAALTPGARTTHYEFFHPDGTPMAEPDLPIRRAILGESVRGAEYGVRLADGTQRALRAHAVPLPAPEGRRQAVAVVQDITERKRAEDELKRLAAENEALYERAAREAHVKGLLLDELDHRVRNNLALIVSLMELQRANPAARSVAEVLDDGIARVKGLALLHDLLGGAGAHFGDYRTLVRRLADQALLNGQVGGRVAFRLEAVPLSLPSAQLTALGLITNELFINIAKHAFPDGRSGTVEVTVESTGSDGTVRIRDDGVGIPPGPAEAPGRLGLNLIRSLVEVSLQGTFALETGPGTTAVIRFPLPETSPALA